MSEKDKAAPVGEREAFEAWLDTLPDATGAIAMAKDEWDEQQARYFKRESCPDLNSAFAAFKAGAAYQRQVHAEHEGPDYGDGPEFEGWAERSGQQLQSAEAVAFEVKNPNTGRVKLYRGSKEHLMVGFALAGYIVRPLYTTPQPSAVPDGWRELLQEVAEYAPPYGTIVAMTSQMALGSKARRMLAAAPPAPATVQNVNQQLLEALENTAAWIEQLPVPTVGAAGQLVKIDAAIAAARQEGGKV